ncbi:fatty acid desaturase family protein [Streptomyces sp. NPDC056672]|uniref:fatty acid desaturase family protein n=1 Tax=Streptomyces sp. NPDC056672 TaxID=3345906 RepID=UPI0036B3003E
MNTDNAVPKALFERTRVSRNDELVFVTKLAVALLLSCLGGFLTLTSGLLGASIGVLLLAAMYTHMVELQHQCLHHSAFRRSSPHRPVGFLLGLPLLSAYSHFRVQHLQHHRYLGTPDDSEFFGFDPRAPLTWGALLRGTLSPVRLLQVAADVVKSCRGNWTYTMGQIADRARRQVITEYRLFALYIVGAATLSIGGYGHAVLMLWVLPLLLSIPIHFLLELPEHVLCENDSTDVLRNTRTISGSWFSQWFTNGNNFHVEHHASMVVPINRLQERHPVAKEYAVHTDDSYVTFYAKIMKEASHNRGQRDRLDAAEK